MKWKTYDTFDGELLFTAMEVDITVSMDDGEIGVWVRDADITDQLSDEELETLSEQWGESKQAKVTSDALDKADYEYDCKRDAMLEEAMK